MQIDTKSTSIQNREINENIQNKEINKNEDMQNDTFENTAENSDANITDIEPWMKLQTLTIEQIYQKKTQHQHILDRPDTYIGSIEVETDKLWVLNDTIDDDTIVVPNIPSPISINEKNQQQELLPINSTEVVSNTTNSLSETIETINNENNKINIDDINPASPPSIVNTIQYKPPRIISKEITYVPGQYKIFDEILVNAADNKQRDPSMSEIRINIDINSGIISIWNNGKGIPVVKHKEYDIYIPELIFGHLLTSSNYNDNEKRTVGGRNGYGAKLTNIFSKEFIIETLDSERHLRYKQKFYDNMFRCDKPSITTCKNTTSWTKITFLPDYARFNMDKLTNDTMILFKKRCYDIAGTSGNGQKVYLNGTRILIKNFKEYCDLYFETPINNNTMLKRVEQDQSISSLSSSTRIHSILNERWEIMIAPTDGKFEQVSFVNSICTSKGGTHINIIVDMITKYLLEYCEKKYKKTDIKSNHIRNHMWIFCNCQIDNPTFDTQTKVYMTSKKQNFGTEPNITETFVRKLLKIGIIDNALSYAQYKQDKDMKKSDGKKKGRLIGIPKLEDANMAGTSRSKDCTLIQTEGDSAKALAMSGITIVGRDLFGVFPQRGKLLNVREASSQQILKNSEITYLKQILGLKQNEIYTDTSTLRYGHVMIMTDQDYDGAHIKGQIINMFDTFWPSQLKIQNFLTEFITPIVKVTKGKNELPFYTIPQYEMWRNDNDDGKGWKIKYYKGLGTSTPSEGKMYFTNIINHRKEFYYTGDLCKQAINLAFNRNLSDNRKEWMSKYEQGTYLDRSTPTISYVDFINKEQILFSIASNQRSIPSVIDGCKVGQRKVLYSCFKRKQTNEMKVSQLCGYIADVSAYHHGEQSLCGTIINLAQNFVGSNNINYLWPCGQFGTRSQGGNNAASPRYIFTHLSPITRILFQPNDDPILDYLNDDGYPIEPQWYIPIIPAALVNGTSGIGMGWSTDIPNFNPYDLINSIRDMIYKRPYKQIHPYYKNFIGKVIVKPHDNSYIIRGNYKWITSTCIYISEQPIGRWTSDYKQWIEDKQSADIFTSYYEYHTDDTVAFVINIKPDIIPKIHEQGEYKFFKLESTITLTNMVLFDKNNCIKKYNTIKEIIDEFYTVRLQCYSKRKEYLIQCLQKDIKYIDNKVRFIEYVVQDKIKLRNVKRIDILQQQYDMNFESIKSEKDKDITDTGTDTTYDDHTMIQEELNKANGYDYLQSMPLWSLTYERIQSQNKDMEDKRKRQNILLETSLEDMWQKELDQQEIALRDHEKAEQDERKISTDKLASKNTKTVSAIKKNIKKSSNNNKYTVPEYQLEPRPTQQTLEYYEAPSSSSSIKNESIINDIKSSEQKQDDTTVQLASTKEITAKGMIISKNEITPKGMNKKITKERTNKAQKPPTKRIKRVSKAPVTSESSGDDEFDEAQQDEDNSIDHTSSDNEYEYDIKDEDETKSGDEYHVGQDKITKEESKTLDNDNMLSLSLSERLERRKR